MVAPSLPRSLSDSTIEEGMLSVLAFKQSMFAGMLDGEAREVGWQLGRATVVDGVSSTIALCAAVALIRSRMNPAWLVLLGAAVGAVLQVAGAR